MLEKDLAYREEHAVVPQLDFTNGGYDNIVAPPVQYSPYAALGSITKINGGQVASGVTSVLDGALHMASGDFGYGIGKLFSGVTKTATGVVDPGYVGVQKIVCDAIREWEEDVWAKRFFMKIFTPAEGEPGDIVCEIGEFDDNYCGLGHRFFENGDYFEGMFMDGKIFEGIYLFANGARYLGCFDENLHFTGLGVLMYADGTCYYGGFNQSQRDKVGAMWYTDGVYVGNWSNGLRHGDGFLRVGDKFFEGEFYNDQMCGAME